MANSLVRWQAIRNSKWPAGFFKRWKIKKQWTVIESGAYADLFLVNGNSQEDIGLLGTPDKSLAVIVKNGAVIKNNLAK